MKALLIFVVVLVSTSLLLSDIVHVPADTSSIQGGIYLANDGDTVLVAENTYYENINFNGKAITVASQFIMDDDTNHISKTVIDGGNAGSVVTFISGEDTNSVICGFKITGGSGTKIDYNISQLWDQSKIGAGILVFNAGVRICWNIIEKNSIDHDFWAAGAGICAINDNDAYQVIIENNVIKKNSVYSTMAVMGGGIYILGEKNTYFRIINNEICYNTLSGEYDDIIGAGIGCQSEPARAAEIIISENYIAYNNAISLGNPPYSGGGGIAAWHSCPQIISNVIIKNSSTRGGGILSNCLSQPRIINNTIADNSAAFLGGGILIEYSSMLIKNSIVWNNSAPIDPGLSVNNADVDMSYSDIQGGWSGEGNIENDPQFDDSLYHLSISSPCVDGGDPNQKFNDPDDPENSGTALWPALGGLHNDIGAYGGNPLVKVDMPAYPQLDAFIYDSHVFNEHEMMYRLLYPNNYKEDELYPLIVVLHGWGGEGEDNERHMVWALEYAINNEKYGLPAFILAPQCPESVVLRLPWNTTASLEILNTLIDSLESNLPVDINRIYVTGMSAGGHGSYRVIRENPNRYAAAVPIAGFYKSSEVPAMEKSSLWIFHGDRDRDVPVNNSRKMINAFESIGRKVVRTQGMIPEEIESAIDRGENLIYTEMEKMIHWCSRLVYENPLLYKWIDKQRFHSIRAINSKLNSNFMNKDTLVLSTNIINPYECGFQAKALINNLDSTIFESVLLINNGHHGDKIANDAIWSGKIAPFGDEEEYVIGIEVTNFDSNQVYMFEEVERFTTIGPIEIDSVYISNEQPLPGETTLLRFRLRNSGTLVTANSVSISLTKLDTCAIYLPSIYSYGDISAGESKDISQGFSIKIKEDCPGGCAQRFLVEIYSNNHFYWSDSFALDIATSIAEDENQIPSKFFLSQNYPNPFNPNTTINYQLPKTDHVELNVYNIIGQKVVTLVSKTQPAGNHQVEWDASGFASGIYYYMLKAGDYREVKKMVLMK